ncbi:MAG: NUDIX domain-containing protein, partial [Thermoplasmata archaeon]|nr:NUDIX domain-containing protein [Thermoplasmata archaeon]
RIFSFPFGKGSTVGSYAMYQLRLNGLAPAGIVNGTAEPIIATGAIIADLPMIDGVDSSLIRTGDDLSLDADQGVLELIDVSEKHVVTCILRNKGKILLLRRSNEVGSYQGRWAGVSGFIECGEGDADAARRELEEEIGRDKARLTKRAQPRTFRDGRTAWVVHPFLFDVGNRSVRLDWEHSSFEWISPSELPGFSTVPGLQEIICELLA